MATVRIDATIEIDATPKRVWDAIADYAFDLEWRKGLTEMAPDPPGPPEVGTRVHEVGRTAGRAFTNDCTVTRVEAGVEYEFEGTGTNGDFRGRRTVRATPAGGTSFTYWVELHPRGIAGVIAPLLSPMIRSGMQADLRRLKALLEQEPGGAVNPER
jgi:uncharacterized protein YndB with AHSA1/START domain